MAALFVAVTSWIWLVLEIGLVVRDRRRGKGSASLDRGSRRAVVILTVIASVGSTAVQVLLPAHSALRLSAAPHVPWAPPAGLAVMWFGLVLRVWAITVLGRSFRTTVEIDTDQRVVDRGPYRWVRHPSYSGLLLITLGYGLAADNWISLGLMIVLPLSALLWRITVEERALVSTLGGPYETYRARTKRLVPGLW
ncbi:MAG TPA: isoprenylcysteine carboxylmethyltransferase family protein [Pseudonocardiaceae bacterium]|nr:isoprenylcysteine carboxylmethyltransferase family protein [Pseudonocardiaceae bacterium]